MSAAEHHYICAHGHEWTTVPSDRMRCPHCGTITHARHPLRDHPFVCVACEGRISMEDNAIGFAGGLWHPACWDARVPASTSIEETER